MLFGLLISNRYLELNDLAPTPKLTGLCVVSAVSVRRWERACRPPGIPASQELRTLRHLLWWSRRPVPSEVRPGGRCKVLNLLWVLTKSLPKNTKILAVKKPSNSKWRLPWWQLVFLGICVHFVATWYCLNWSGSGRQVAGNGNDVASKSLPHDHDSLQANGFWRQEKI